MTVPSTYTCPFWVKNEAIDSHILALKHSINRTKNFGRFWWIHLDAKNVKFLRCNHVRTISYLGLLVDDEIRREDIMIKNQIISLITFNGYY